MNKINRNRRKKRIVQGFKEGNQPEKGWKSLLYAKMATYTRPWTPYESKKITSEVCNKTPIILDNPKKKKYEVILERLGDKRNVDEDQTDKTHQKGAALNTTIDLKNLEENQEIDHSKQNE